MTELMEGLEVPVALEHVTTKHLLLVELVVQVLEAMMAVLVHREKITQAALRDQMGLQEVVEELEEPVVLAPKIAYSVVHNAVMSFLEAVGELEQQEFQALQEHLGHLVR